MLNVRGVMALPQTCPTADGVAWLWAEKERVVVQSVGAGSWSQAGVAKGKVVAPLMLALPSASGLVAKAREAWRSILGWFLARPTVVRVRVEVDCTPPANGGPLPEVKVRVELVPTPARSIALLPEVKVRVEPPNTTTTSSGTVPTVTTSSPAPKPLPGTGSTAT